MYQNTLRGSGIAILDDTMVTWGFTDIYILSPRACSPRALGVYISKIPRSHGITIICTMLLGEIKGFYRGIPTGW